jgi:FMN phosphatase YigB (HAD superfamily)
VFSSDWEGPYQFLLNEFSSQGRSFLFDKFITHFSLPYSTADILDLFRCYENAPDSLLTTYPWFQKLSDRLNHRFPLLLITNGNKDQQRRKIEELNLVEFFPHIHCVFADEYGGKPEVEPFKALAKKVVLHDPIYIGDSEVDRAFCGKCKIEFFNVKNLMT